MSSHSQEKRCPVCDVLFTVVFTDIELALRQQAGQNHFSCQSCNHMLRVCTNGEIEAASACGEEYLKLLAEEQSGSARREEIRDLLDML